MVPKAGDYVERPWATLQEYFRSFYEIPAYSFSPYTSLISPAGTGKTRAVEELARRDKCFVSYLNSSPPKSLTSPERSIIANKIAEIESREDLTTYFECYVASILVQAKLCYEIGLTPRAFWDLQARKEFTSYQKDLAGLIGKLYARAERTLMNEKLKEPLAEAGAAPINVVQRTSYLRSLYPLDKED